MGKSQVAGIVGRLPQGWGRLQGARVTAMSHTGRAQMSNLISNFKLCLGNKNSTGR